MQKAQFFGFEVEIDERVTRAWYTGSEGWGCACGHCQNFLSLARDRALPDSVLELLDRLGIPPEKPTYLCELYCQPDGHHFYQVSYRIAGLILAGEEDAFASLSWGSARCYHEIYPYGAPDFPKPHFDLEFGFTLPWVLDEPGEGERDD